MSAEPATPAPEPSTPEERQLVDRVRRELARRRALAEAIRPPKRRPASGVARPPR